MACWVALVTLAPLDTAHAQDDAGTYTVALFTPSLDFRDGTERNAFVSEVADSLSSETGVSWRGKAFARRSDFESELRKGTLDIVIVDGEYFAAKGGRFDAVASLEAGSSTSRRMALVVDSGSSVSALYELRGRTIAVADSAGGSAVESFLGGDPLGGEVSADDFFGRIETVKDVRAAINAVELGKADAALIFEDYAGGGLRVVERTSSVPLPVVAVTSSRLDGELLTATRNSARSLSVDGASLVTGSGGYDSGSVRDFKSASARKRKRIRPEGMAPAPLGLDLGAPRLPGTPDALEPAVRSDDVTGFLIPSIDTLEGEL